MSEQEATAGPAIMTQAMLARHHPPLLVASELPSESGWIRFRLMGAFDGYAALVLRGGFLLKSVRSAGAPMADALGRPALARTTIIGSTLEIELSCEFPPQEVSITFYHEVLEAAAVAALRPPEAVCELNEAGFKAAARRMYADFGSATPDTLNRMLELFGF